MLQMLAEITSPGEFTELLRLGISSYSDYCRNMAQPDVRVAAIRAEAHRLKGSSGSLGFRRIGELALRLELLPDDGHGLDRLLRELREAIRCTEQELAALDLLPATKLGGP